MSGRHGLGMIGGGVLFLSLALGFPQGPKVVLPGGFLPAPVDLTHPLHPAIPLFSGAFEWRPLTRYADGYYSNAFACPEHTGTHVDAPAHFVEGRWSVDEIPASRLVGPAAVVDVQGAVAKNPDYLLNLRDLEQWERRHGPLPQGGILLVRTGWGKRWEDAAAYRNVDAQGVFHFPGISPEAAEFLVQRRRLVGVGIDTLSLDHGPSKDFRTHHILLGANLYGIENLAHLEALPPVGATLVVAPLPIRKGSGAPARVLAFLPQGRR